MGYYSGKLMGMQATGSSDADAQAFIIATGITDAIQIDAIQTLVSDLKTNNLWNKMKAIYPFIGGTAITHKFNLKDPRDLNAAFRLTFYGGIVHSETGIKANGTTGYADTNMNALSNINKDNVSLCVYNRENIAKGCDIGCEFGSNPTLRMITKYSNGNTFVEINNTATSGTNLSINASGCFIASRVSSTSHKTYRNGLLILTDTKTSVNPPNMNIAISASIAANGQLYYDTKQKAFVSVGEGLTEIEVADLYTTVQQYNTILGRQV